MISTLLVCFNLWLGEPINLALVQLLMILGFQKRTIWVTQNLNLSYALKEQVGLSKLWILLWLDTMIRSISLWWSISWGFLYGRASAWPQRRESYMDSIEKYLNPRLAKMTYSGGLGWKIQKTTFLMLKYSKLLSLGVNIHVKSSFSLSFFNHQNWK